MIPIKCDKHRRDHVGACMWCGKKVCEFCITRKDGAKLYCEKCGPMLAPVRREPLPRVGKAPPPAAGRKFVLKDGYLVIQE